MKEADFSDIQARLKREGAAFAGVQVSLAWNTCDDLDLHVIEPSGAVINYQNRKSSSGGKLDIDMNRDDDNISMQPVENIFWPDGAARKGRYRVQVHLYKRRSPYNMLSVPFQVMVKNQGTMMRFNGQVSHGKVDVTKFTARNSVLEQRVCCCIFQIRPTADNRSRMRSPKSKLDKPQ